MTTKRPTLRDIAQSADVALSTVSQVLNQKPGVSPELRQRVLEVATSLGYKQRIEIDSPLTPQLRTLALLSWRISNEPTRINPFYSQIITGAERECQRRGIALIYANLHMDANERALSLPGNLITQQLDGLLIVGKFPEEAIATISKQISKNIILIDTYTSSQTAFDSVLIDNVRGAYSAVTHLIENGHRHIGLIGSSPDSVISIQERREGYLKALQEHQIENIHIEPSILMRSEAYEATFRLMRRSPEITAIFACNDDVAIGVMSALRTLGLTVPGDVSVVGFDDIDLAREVTPPLTTMHVDKVFMGVMAVRHLRGRAEMPDRPVLTTLVSTHLIIRGSTQSI